MTSFNALEMSKRRWPHCRIEGSGSLAVILACSYRVVLCTLPIEASAIVSKPCCENCAHGIMEGRWHTVEVLQPPAQPRTPRNNFAAFMAAD